MNTQALQCDPSPLSAEVLPVISVSDCTIDKLTWGPGESLVHVRKTQGCSKVPGVGGFSTPQAGQIARASFSPRHSRPRPAQAAKQHSFDFGVVFAGPAQHRLPSTHHGGSNSTGGGWETSVRKS